MITRTYKVGMNRGKPRIWLDGKVLTDAGFTGGSSYSLTVRLGVIWLTKDALQDSQPRKVTGRPDGKPIVDITGNWLLNWLAANGSPDHVKVTFKAGLVTIKPNNE